MNDKLAKDKTKQSNAHHCYQSALMLCALNNELNDRNPWQLAGFKEDIAAR